MAVITITAASVLPSTQAILNRQYNFGTGVTQGQAVYLDVNNLWQLANALTSATTAAVRGVAVNAGSSGQPATVCTSDPAFTVGGTLTVGVPVIVGSAGGALNPVTDVATGWFTAVVGMPISTTQLALAPIVGGQAHA